MWWKQQRHLKSDDVQQRVKATQSLGAAKGDRAHDALIHALQDESLDVRRSAADALGRSGDMRAVEPLLRMLEDADLFSGQAAESALQALGWQPADARQRAVRAVVTRHFDAAVAEGAEAVEPLIAALVNADQDGRKAEVVTALGKTCDPRVLEPLGSVLKSDTTPAVRSAAAAALAVVGDHRGVDSLVVSLTDDDARVRMTIVEALTKIGSPCTDLLSEYLGHIKPTVRTAAATALGQIRDPRTTRPLLWALKDPQVDVRSAAASALRNAHEDQVVEPLVAALADAHWAVRRSAAAALGQVGDGRAVEPLVKLLEDADILVRSQATEALGRIADERATLPLIRVLQETGASILGVDDGARTALRICAAQGLGRTGSEAAVEPLIEVHRERSEPLREAVTAALQQIGGPAVDYLVPVMEQETDLFERRWAVNLLGKIGDSRAVEALIGMLRRDPKAGLRAAAAEALAEIGDPSAIAPLERALDDADVRTSAANALKRLRGAEGVESAGAPELVAA